MSARDPPSANPPTDFPSPPAHRGTGAAPPSRGPWVVAGIVATVVLVAGVLVGLHYLVPSTTPHATSNLIPVVAAENFWGSLVAQLGGTHVSVLSIVSDPNADPHDYESNTTDAIALSTAKLVIQNGDGYDDWCTQLLSSSPNPGRVVVVAQAVVGAPLGVNPHFWYEQRYVIQMAGAMYSALVSIDRADQAYYQQQYAALNTSLEVVWAREAEIQTQFGGTNVSSTESIFQYMANSTGLNLVSPYEFMKAVAEGSDPPAWSVTVFENQLTSGTVSVLVYNLQTVTPLTQQMKAIAASHNVSTVGVTETIQPPDLTFQVWIEGELLALENVLDQKALGV
ncbi:MAG TPA: zinc ABC transporter substrate-binding protein [Thermoplasmata archaeon]|nr:zinc ABC transporter substrate-binding protein [Thermoplasmata archaeon]